MRCPFDSLGWRFVLAVASSLLVSGCSLDRHAWHPAPLVSPIDFAAEQIPPTGLSLAEWHYTQARTLEEADQAACVDHYYQAAAQAWPAIRDMPPSAAATRSWGLYHSAVAQMLSAAQRHGRWKSQVGLMVQGPAGLAPVPAIYHDFAWNPGDFDHLAPVGSYEVPDLDHQFRSTGVGVPLVVVRRAPPVEPFMQDTQSFAATAVLRPSSGDSALSPTAFSQPSCFVLEFLNPLTSDALPSATGNIPLARDLSAPFAYPPRGKDRAWLIDFLLPGSATKDDGLFMLEPYQPGKIPLVLVHGLLSDPLTWTNMVNELRSNRQLCDRYQVWGFRYSTGTQFLGSAALLRQQLGEIRNVYDPQRADPALSRMVLVGHSMGGLLAKLQVVYSGDELWHTFANRPPSEIVTTPDVRGRLIEQLCFDPNPDIARVVFIGTPHQGSEDATRCIGRIGASLAETSAAAKQAHAQLLRDNPGVFNAVFDRRIPNSIDMLEPANPFLLATLRLPFRAGVRFHSICGVMDRPLSSQPSDGVVSLTSARLIGACSEKLVPAKHTKLTRDCTSIAEVTRILCQHSR
ncbi:alpha/beta fold hydrolase [Rubripirellula amarantea]|nr:alpha/beta fold hydrolase [Rubripirellula amarantea]